jgi:hypothetical protein
MRRLEKHMRNTRRHFTTEQHELAGEEGSDKVRLNFATAAAASSASSYTIGTEMRQEVAALF